MATLEVSYEGREYVLDLEDMDTDDARAMEKIGVKNLKALQDGVAEGDRLALTVAYWLMLKQNGEPGVRIERVNFKLVKFLLALNVALENAAEEEGPKDAE